MRKNFLKHIMVVLISLFVLTMTGCDKFHTVTIENVEITLDKNNIPWKAINNITWTMANVFDEQEILIWGDKDKDGIRDTVVCNHVFRGISLRKYPVLDSTMETQ